MSTEWLGQFVHDVADFPEPGVVFKDITPLLRDIDALRLTVEVLADPYVGRDVDAVVGVDARGFIFGAPVAYRLGCGFVPLRKAGKLPRATHSQDFVLEYGVDRLEIHQDALKPGDRVLLIDDVLATGGTAAAACELVAQAGASLAGAGFVIGLDALGGTERLRDATGPDIEPLIMLRY